MAVILTVHVLLQFLVLACDGLFDVLTDQEVRVLFFASEPLSSPVPLIGVCHGVFLGGGLRSEQGLRYSRLFPKFRARPCGA